MSILEKRKNRPGEYTSNAIGLKWLVWKDPATKMWNAKAGERLIKGANLKAVEDQLKALKAPEHRSADLLPIVRM
jgi:hypothetical protein